MQTAYLPHTLALLHEPTDVNAFCFQFSSKGICRLGINSICLNLFFRDQSSHSNDVTDICKLFAGQLCERVIEGFSVLGSETQMAKSPALTGETLLRIIVMPGLLKGFCSLQTTHFKHRPSAILAISCHKICVRLEMMSQRGRELKRKRNSADSVFPPRIGVPLAHRKGPAC